MSLATRLLNLSMKEQICIAIIGLTLFCIGVILIVCCSLMYEILNKDYQQKKLYFYKRYKEYLESAFYFQNFYLMQYEEIIHRIQKQLWKMEQATTIYFTYNPTRDYSDYFINIDNTYNFTELDEKNEKETPYFYYISYNSNQTMNAYINIYTMKNYQILANSIITHDIYDYFRIPGYNVPIIERSPNFININYLTIFGFDRELVKEFDSNFSILAQESNMSKEDIFKKTFSEGKNLFFNKTKSFLYYISDKLEIFSYTYDKLYKEATSYYPDFFTNVENANKYTGILSAYCSLIDYFTNTIDILNTDNTNDYFYTRMLTIPNILYFLNSKLTYSLDIDFIPIHFENSTILSKELCSIFKIKQKFLKGNDFNYEEVYNDINTGSNIDICFLDKDILKEQEEIKEVFDSDLGIFMDMHNFLYQGIFNLIKDNNDCPFYFIKYSFPNYNSLKEFQSEYLISNQINYYAFTSFKVVQKYVDHVYQVSLNIFFFIVMVIVYSWLICLVINLIIFFRVIDQWTEPITKLQEAVESSNIKDESIFIYKYDDIINELFLTCKELLTGQIDNTENNLNNFNILGKEKDKKIDKNIYKKNLIINNEIMEELINKQQSMLDFSNNIKTNEPNSINTHTSPKVNKSLIKKSSSIENIKSLDNKKSEKKDSEKVKAEKRKENEPYINLFKIAEYLQFYRSKLESNNVMFLNGETDESKMSRMLSKNTKSINSSVSNQKNKNDENNENNYINMLDEKNISYLWYIETKKKYKNFNYTISSDYRELFTEFNDSYKNIRQSDDKKSIHAHKKDKNAGA